VRLEHGNVDSRPRQQRRRGEPAHARANDNHRSRVVRGVLGTGTEHVRTAEIAEIAGCVTHG
jgi:hypothetical protein